MSSWWSNSFLPSPTHIHTPPWRPKKKTFSEIHILRFWTKSNWNPLPPRPQKKKSNLFSVDDIELCISNEKYSGWCRRRSRPVWYIYIYMDFNIIYNGESCLKLFLGIKSTEYKYVHMDLVTDKLWALPPPPPRPQAIEGVYSYNYWLENWLYTISSQVQQQALHRVQHWRHQLFHFEQVCTLYVHRPEAQAKKKKPSTFGVSLTLNPIDFSKVWRSISKMCGTIGDRRCISLSRVHMYHIYRIGLDWIYTYVSYICICINYVV